MRIVQSGSSIIADANRRVPSPGMTVIIAETQDLNELWRKKQHGAHGRAVLDIHGSNPEDNYYLAARMLNPVEKKLIEKLADGVVRMPCLNIAEAQLRKGKIEEHVRNSSGKFEMPDCVTHLMDESSWTATDLCRANGGGVTNIQLPMAALNVPHGDQLTMTPIEVNGTVVGWTLILASAGQAQSTPAPAPAPEQAASIAVEGLELEAGIVAGMASK